MKKLVAMVCALLSLSCCGTRTQEYSIIRKTDKYSLKMVWSEMVRNPCASFLDGRNGALKWNYTTGLELLSFLDVDGMYPDASRKAAKAGLKPIFDYVENWADSITTDMGPGANYKKANYNLDHICPARIYFRLFEATGKEKYRNAMDVVYEQLESQPRTEAGPFWHKAIYPYQVWLDGLYMSCPFYAEYAGKYLDEASGQSAYEDIAREFRIASGMTSDPETGLFRHAWDESREMFWCDPQTGRSAHAWGRACGWYSVALVETLQYLPSGSPAYEELASELVYLMGAVKSWADPVTGMWYQVLDCPARRTGEDGNVVKDERYGDNYLEATCSAMFTYACLKGIRLGVLDGNQWLEYGKGLYRSLLDTFVKENADGTISLTSCCAVAGLGGQGRRSGTYEYYLSEPVIENDCKGVGPFIWASLEYERL